MRVAIVHNRVSAEMSADARDVVVQVEAVLGGLRRLGHDAVPVACTLNLHSLRRRLVRLAPDVVFNLVESLAGTDRLMHLVPALLDGMNLPYTGAPTWALLRSADKLAAKRELAGRGLPTPDWYCRGDDSRGARRLPPAGTYILKSVHEHASFGLDDQAVVEIADQDALDAALAQRAEQTGRPWFAERFVEGREFNLSLLATAGTPQVLPPAEIDFSSFPPGKPRIVAYDAKWDARSFAYAHTPRSFDFPAADQGLLASLCQLATACWELFSLRGFARVDLRVDTRQQPWILEVNANPCLAPDAGFAAALDRARIPREEALERILEDALAGDLVRPRVTL